MIRNKKVLIITYYWPPAGGPGVQRALKFAKYLLTFGWQPIILTVENGEYSVIDNSLEKDIPEKCIVYKTETKDSFKLYKKFIGKKSNEKVRTDLNSTNSKEAFANFIRLNLIIPDARKGWIPTILDEGTKIIKQHNPKYIFATSPPHSVQVGAAKLAKMHHIKLISDYRDPWLEIVYYQNKKRSMLTKHFDGILEKKTMNAAHKIITISEDLKKIIENKIDGENKVHVIPNGFDKDDFKNVRIKQNKIFTLTYAGVINDERIPHALLDAMQNLKKKNIQVKLRFFGKVCMQLRELVTQKQLKSSVEFHDFISHDKVISEMMNSQALLFVIDNVPENNGFLTGKLFDYLGCMRPIIGIGPIHGDAAKILQKTDSGRMLHYSDRKGVSEFLSLLVQDWGKNYERFSFKSEDYSRKNLTAQLVEILNDELGKNQKRTNSVILSGDER